MVVFSLVYHLGYAQNADEWLQQKKTQLRYLAEQVAALKVYGAYVEQGYKVVRGGLTAIGDVKRGEFSLHKDYFAGLLEAKPAIQSNWKIGTLVLSAQRLLKLYKQSGATLIKLEGSNPQYSKDLSIAWSGVLAAVGNTLSELQLFANSKELQLPDAARISRIDQLLKQMQLHEAFAIELSSSALAILENERLETTSSKTVKSLYRK